MAMFTPLQFRSWFLHHGYPTSTKMGDAAMMILVQVGILTLNALLYPFLIILVNITLTQGN